MAEFYRRHILKEEAPREGGLIQIQGVGGALAKAEGRCGLQACVATEFSLAAVAG